MENCLKREELHEEFELENAEKIGQLVAKTPNAEYVERS